MFLLYLEGNEEGCDHTIRCGIAIENIKTETLEEASFLAEEKIDYYGIERINRAIIYEIKSSVEINLLSIKSRSGLLERKRQLEEELNQIEEELNQIEIK